MRSRTLLLALVVTTGAVALPYAAHAAIPFFGPIVPTDINRCAAGWGALLQVINNIISFLITIVIVFVAPIMIAYAGFLFVVNPVNAGGKEKAKKVLLNTVVGLVIALCGYLIVDAVMAVLYNPTPGSNWAARWSQIVIGDKSSFCLIQDSALQKLNQADLKSPDITGVSATGVITTFAGLKFDPLIDAQVKDESGPLATLLTCVASKLPTGVGRISSISDNLITTGQKTFLQCATQGGCAHSINSCHYGGKTCIGKSYAVDFGDDENIAILTAASKACGAQTLNEGTHLHASVGTVSGCGCGI